MSVEKRGDRWRARWEVAGRYHSRTFDRKKDAEKFDADIRRRRQLGPLAAEVLVSRITLTDFVRDEWWPKYAIPNLKPSTRRRYMEVFSTHLKPRLGGYELGQITPAVVEDLAAQLHSSNLGPASQRKTLLLLQGILRRAVVRGLIASNPVAAIDKPRSPARAWPEPLSPDTIERIRASLSLRDATLVSVLAYAGLRPGEATGARWGDVGERSLYVMASKTDRERRVRLLSPLVQDLREWRLASPSGTGPRDLVFPRVQIAQSRRRASLGEWTRPDWSNWRFRTYQPAARAAGVTGDLRPYRCRSSFASLLLWEGRSLAYVAEQDGHSIQTLALHYAGVLEGMEDRPRVSAEDAIRQARETARKRRTA